MDKITSSGVIGRFFSTLEETPSMYVEPLAMQIASNQAEEEYGFLGMAPAMREFVGGRQAKGLRENSFKIRNSKYESTLKVSVDDLRRDKTGQLMIRINDQARRAVQHKDKLILSLVAGGASGICYDGQYFFDTDHVSGNSGTQSNKIDVDISAMPVSTHGTTTAPSAGEMAYAIAKGIESLMSFKDDQGEPVNEMMSEILVTVPVSFMSTVGLALSGKPLEQGDTSVVGTIEGFTVRAKASPRLSAWTDTFAIFRTDSDIKPFILQEELPIEMSAIAEGSELEFEEDVHHYGIKWIGAAGYGEWQNACLIRCV